VRFIHQLIVKGKSALPWRVRFSDMLLLAQACREVNIEAHAVEELVKLLKVVVRERLDAKGH
jgi:hypothetical protein